MKVDGVYSDYANTVLDASIDAKRALLKRAEALQEERDEELAPQYAAQARRDYMAYRG